MRKISESVEYFYILCVIATCICALADLDMIDEFIHRSPVKHLQIQILSECPYTRFAGQKHIQYNGKERGNHNDRKNTKTHSATAV